MKSAIIMALFILFTLTTLAQNLTIDSTGAKSPAKGQIISIAATSLLVGAGTVLFYRSDHQDLPVGIIIGGLIVGPSAGYTYANEPWNGAKGIFWRAGIMASSYFVGDVISRMALISSYRRPEDGHTVAMVFLYTGGTVALIHGIVAIADLGDEIRDDNLRNNDSFFSLNPYYLPEYGTIGIHFQKSL